MPTKKETEVTKNEIAPAMLTKVSSRYLAELARFSTWLSAAMIVAMTFLLLAGLRTPKLPLLVSLYVTLGAFGLSLLSYLFTGWISMQLADGVELSGEKAVVTRNRLNFLRKAQQLFFLIGLIALAVFVAEVSLLFFPSSGSGAAATTPQ